MSRAFCFFALIVAVVALTAGCNTSSDPNRAIAKAQQYREKGDNKAAIIELKTVLQKSPNHGELRYLLGVTYHDAKDYRQSEQELRRALDLSYERSKVMPVLGKSMLMLGEFQKILDQIPVEAHAGNVVQADVLTLRARALMGLGRLSQAREMLDAALVKQPDFPDALVQQGRLAAGDQKFDDAGRLIDRAIARSPKHIDAWIVKGELARVRGDEAGVLAASLKVIEIDPKNISARLSIVSLHIANKRLDEARKMIAEARKLAPGDVMTQHMQALVDFQARDYKTANETIQQVLKVAPNNLPSVILAGAILTELGSYEQAQVHLASALSLAPGNLYVRKLMLSSLARSGQVRRALEVLQPGLKQAPEDRQLMLMAGELYLEGGEFGKAAAYFDKVAARDPKDPLARYKLGLSRLAAGDTDKAFSDLEAAVAIDSTKYEADTVLVVSYLTRGKYDQALKVMESLEKKQPKNPVTFNLKAAIYMGKKDVSSARKYLERALELSPTFLPAAKNVALLDLEDKNIKAARGRIESLLEKDKNDVQVLLTLAEMGPRLGASSSEVIDWLVRASKANSGSVQPHLKLARAYIQAADAKKALETALQARTISPDNIEVLDTLGSIQLLAGETGQAITTYSSLATLQPNSPAVLYRLARIHIGNGGDQLAATTLRKALALKPDFTDAQITLVELELRAERYTEAMSIVQQVRKQSNKSALGFVLEGDVLVAQKQFVQAAKAYDAAYRIGKTGAVVMKSHSALMQAGKSDDADSRLMQWLKDSPDDLDVRQYAADASLDNGNFKSAIEQYEWLLTKSPKNSPALNNLAWAYYKVKDPRALETAERALSLKPDSPAFMDTLGWILVEQGKTTHGVEMLRKAVAAAPKDHEIRYHYIQALVKSGDKGQAISLLERIVAPDAKFPRRADAAALLQQLRGGTK